jgi:hypothetical protein
VYKVFSLPPPLVKIKQITDHIRAGAGWPSARRRLLPRDRPSPFGGLREERNMADNINGKSVQNKNDHSRNTDVKTSDEVDQHKIPEFISLGDAALSVVEKLLQRMQK